LISVFSIGSALKLRSLDFETEATHSSMRSQDLWKPKRRGNQVQQKKRLVIELRHPVEELKILGDAVKALEKPGLSKTEIMRLKALIQATGSYQKKFADYINYRKIEQRVIEATEELERLAKREQERADKPRITGKGFTRSRTSLHNGARPASFIRPNNQAKGKEVTTKE